MNKVADIPGNPLPFICGLPPCVESPFTTRRCASRCWSLTSLPCRKCPAWSEAGSLIWINFDRHALLNLVRKAAGTFLANVDDIRPQFRVAEQEFLSQTAIFDAALTRDTGSRSTPTIDQTAVQLSSVSGFKEEAAP